MHLLLSSKYKETEATHSTDFTFTKFLKPWNQHLAEFLHYQIMLSHCFYKYQINIQSHFCSYQVNILLWTSSSISASWLVVKNSDYSSLLMLKEIKTQRSHHKHLKAAIINFWIFLTSLLHVQSYILFIQTNENTLPLLSLVRQGETPKICHIPSHWKRRSQSPPLLWTQFSQGVTDEGNHAPDICWCTAQSSQPIPLEIQVLSFVSAENSQ